MDFLIDRCIGSGLADWLRRNGHNALEARSLGPDPGDRALLELAASSHRVMLTIDSDFGELIYRHNAAHAGLIRLPDVPAQRRIEMMAEVLHRHRQDLANRAIVTIRGGRIRVSQPPIN